MPVLGRFDMVADRSVCGSSVAFQRTPEVDAFQYGVRLSTRQSVHRVRTSKGGQGDGSHPAWCKLFTSGVRTFPERREVQNGTLLVGRAQDALPRAMLKCGPRP